MVKRETNRWAAHALVDTLVHEGRPEHEIAVAADESAAALRVLVADDEPVTRLDLAGVLAEAGFDVCAEAATGREAVTLAFQHGPDAIVMDADMPQLDGVAAAREILAVHDVAIVMLSGYGYGEAVDRAFDAGVRGYVVKPYSELEVVDAVRGALRRAA
jgi:two-component system, response regulator PdtaR